MSYLAILLLSLVAYVFGGWLLQGFGTIIHSRSQALVARTLGGWVVLHLTLHGLQALGISWSRLSVGLGLGVSAFFLLYLADLAPPQPRLDRVGWGWGDGVAGVSFLGFTWSALAFRATTPDFVFHWGIKGQRFFLAQGVDLHFLTRHWNHYAHPDYPTLLPELYALGATVAGKLDDRSWMLWSVLVFALLVLAARDLLRVAEASRWLCQGALAVTALVAATFAIGHGLAGGADLLVALGLLAALPSLMAPEAPGADSRLGVAVAFVASSKIEGVPLAGILLGVYLLLGLRERCLTWLHPVRALVLPLLAIAVWLVPCLDEGLFQATNAGTINLGRLGLVLTEGWNALQLDGWHGWGAVLLMLPLLLGPSRSRVAAGALLLQLGFYLYAYLVAPFDTEGTRFLVLTSFPRLAFHLVPAALVAAALALEPLAVRSPAGEPAAEATGEPLDERAAGSKPAAQTFLLIRIERRK